MSKMGNEQPVSSSGNSSRTTDETQMSLREKGDISDLMDTELDDVYRNSSAFKNVLRKRTAYCFFPSDKHSSLWDSMHPENPQGAHAVHEAIKPVYDRLLDLSDAATDVDPECMLYLISLVQTRRHRLNTKELCGVQSEELPSQFDNIYCNETLSKDVAINTAKKTIMMAVTVAKEVVQNGFLNLTPPEYLGSPCVPKSCLYNNVAIAAEYLLKHDLAQKILIVDYDIHHGQGTQQAFYDTDRVLYFSMHRYEHGKFWPNLEESSFNHVGSGKGTGHNINVPLNQTGLTDYDYLSIILNLLLPVAYEYDPSIVLVSAGYDACVGSPEGEMNVTPAFYANLIHMLGGLAGGKILVVLEGGYFLPSLADCALQTVRALLNDSCPTLEHHKYVDASVIDSINDVKVALRPYWKCINQVDPISSIADIVRFDRFNYHVAVHTYFGPAIKPLDLNSKSSSSMSDVKRAYLKGTYNSHQNIVGFMENAPADPSRPSSHCPAETAEKHLKDIVDSFTEYNLLKDLKLFEFELVSQYSCGVLCQLASEIKRSTITHGIGVVRPPGHYPRAPKDRSFCLVNNVAVSANYAINFLGYQKVLIIDFDVHHGNDAQELTYSKDIMYITLHKFDGEEFYPGYPVGTFMYVEEKGSIGYKLDLAFNNATMRDSDYLYIWIKIVLPLAYSFKPDIIYVSAGFDAGIDDPCGQCRVVPITFSHLIQLIKPIAPIILALEGGYNTTTSLGMVNCVKALLGHPLPHPNILDVQPEVPPAMAELISIIKPYWPIMEVNKTLDPVIRTQNEVDAVIKQLSKINFDL